MTMLTQSSIDLLDYHQRAGDRSVDVLEPGVVQLTWQIFAPHAAELAASGAFGKPVQVSDDADVQTRLLAMLGRDTRK